MSPVYRLFVKQEGPIREYRVFRYGDGKWEPGKTERPVSLAELVDEGWVPQGRPIDYSWIVRRRKSEKTIMRFLQGKVANIRIGGILYGRFW